MVLTLYPHNLQEGGSIRGTRGYTHQPHCLQSSVPRVLTSTPVITIIYVTHLPRFLGQENIITLSLHHAARGLDGDGVRLRPMLLTCGGVRSTGCRSCNPCSPWLLSSAGQTRVKSGCMVLVTFF